MAPRAVCAELRVGGGARRSPPRTPPRASARTQDDEASWVRARGARRGRLEGAGLDEVGDLDVGHVVVVASGVGARLSASDPTLGSARAIRPRVVVNEDCVCYRRALPKPRAARPRPSHGPVRRAPRAPSGRPHRPIAHAATRRTHRGPGASRSPASFAALSSQALRGRRLDVHPVAHAHHVRAVRPDDVALSSAVADPRGAVRGAKRLQLGDGRFALLVVAATDRERG